MTSRKRSITERLRAAANYRLWSPDEITALYATRGLAPADAAVELNKLPEAQGAVKKRTAGAIERQRIALGIEDGHG